MESNEQHISRVLPDSRMGQPFRILRVGLWCAISAIFRFYFQALVPATTPVLFALFLILFFASLIAIAISILSFAIRLIFGRSISIYQLLLTLSKIIWTAIFLLFPMFGVIRILKYGSYDLATFFVIFLCIAVAVIPWAKSENDVTQYRRDLAVAFGGIVLAIIIALFAHEVYVGNFEFSADCSKARFRAAFGCAVVNILFPFIGNTGTSFIFLIFSVFIFVMSLWTFPRPNKQA